jgi:N-dimethylarginine dimethylaminohydrolase
MVLGPKQLLYCQELISKKDIDSFEGIGISCGGDTTANIICLGDNELIVNRSNSIVIECLEAEKYVVHNLDLGEFAKGMGGACSDPQKLDTKNNIFRGS